MEYGIVNIYRVVQQVPHGAAGLVMIAPRRRNPVEMQDVVQQFSAGEFKCPPGDVGVYYQRGISRRIYKAGDHFQWDEFNEAESGGEK